MGHIKMMAATQPFLSGAISKTVNLPQDASVEDIAEAYIESWRQGLKAVAIYRDGSKGSQPLNVSGTDGKAAKDSSSKPEAAAVADTTLATALADSQAKVATLEEQLAAATQQLQASLVGPLHDSQNTEAPPRAVRHRLPEERASLTHKFAIAGHEGYITVGLYPNGAPGEIFIRMAKEGSTVSGLMDAFATAISLALQHGVPLKVLVEKFAHTRFEPSGWTGNEQIGYAKSIMDYIFRWLQIRFLSGQQLDLFARAAGLHSQAVPVAGVIGAADPTPNVVRSVQADRTSEEPSFPGPYSLVPGPSVGMGTTQPPQAGIATETYELRPDPYQPSLKMEDRGKINPIHAADAMREFMDMGDAPSCGTCGAIMVRNGSCYRCMSCGSTSGCS
jgi:ribonucleoside-diphosphate reductase alpha chain